MLDGLYQSVVCFYMAYLLFRPANFVTDNGLSIDDRERFGVYIGPAAVVVINIYILLNTYRWDWLMVLLVAISILLIFFWTGVYSAFESSDYFFKAAAQAFSQPTFWAVLCLSIILSLLPRFCIKVMQKAYFPYDVDIVREQVRQGKFDYLDKADGSDDAISKGSSTTSSEIVKSSKHTHYPSVDEDQRPIYPPSVAPTATTHNPRSQNGSDGTDYTRHRMSLEVPNRPSMDKPRPSFDRMRASMDRIRTSYEASNDFTSAALLTRMESSQSFGPIQTNRSRRANFSSDLR
jgi:phospholipid-translocating ATPase